MEPLDRWRFIYNKISEVSFSKLNEYVTEMARLKCLPKKETSKLSLDIQYERKFLSKFPEVAKFECNEYNIGIVTSFIANVYFLIKKNPCLSVKEACSRLVQEEIMKQVNGAKRLKTLFGKFENKLWNLKMKRILDRKHKAALRREKAWKKAGIEGLN